MSGLVSEFFKGGLPFNRLGNGPRCQVAFQDLISENRPLACPSGRILLAPFRGLGEHYTVYVVNRRPGLPQSYTLDYSTMMQGEFDASVDLIGFSTGGSIAQVFAADHPELVNRLVLYSSAYKLGAEDSSSSSGLAELAEEVGKRRRIPQCPAHPL